MVQNGDITREKGPKRIGPYGVTKSMSSSISAILATALKLKGINYSISSARSVDSSLPIALEILAYLSPT